MWTFHQTIESALELHLPQCRRPASKPLDDAVRYAIFPGGKRILPVLSQLGASSLDFDDVSSMDDAQIRRGKRVPYAGLGKEIALLAALALLNQSYASFGQTGALIAEAAECIGVHGMIRGRCLRL